MRGPGTWDPFTDDLGDKESAKSKCGKAHFEALAVGEAPARYIVANKFTDVLARV
jgi:type III restriction enzyme